MAGYTQTSNFDIPGMDLSQEEKNRRKAARKERMKKSFLRTPPTRVSSSPPAMATTKEVVQEITKPMPQKSKPVIQPTAKQIKNAVAQTMAGPRGVSTGKQYGPGIPSQPLRQQKQYQVGNIDVTFGEKAPFNNQVSSAAMERFMQQPVGGGGNRVMRPRGGQLIRPDYQQLWGRKKKKGMPEFEGGWQSRLAQKLQWMKGEQNKELAMTQEGMPSTQATVGNTIANTQLTRESIKSKPFERALGQMTGSALLQSLFAQNDADETVEYEEPSSAAEEAVRDAVASQWIEEY